MMRHSLTKTAAAAMACMLASAAQAAFTISNAKTRNVNCASGVCMPAGGNANLNTGDLVSMLASLDVTVKSDAATPDIVTTTRQDYAGGDHQIISGITGLTDDQLKSALPAGFDPSVWGQSASINNGWPYLLANPPQ